LKIGLKPKSKLAVLSSPSQASQKGLKIRQSITSIVSATLPVIPPNCIMERGKTIYVLNTPFSAIPW
jgi:hypothetical protein